MNANERLDDAAIERQIAMLRVEAGIRKRVIALLQEMERELVSKLSGTLTQWSRDRLNKMLEESRKAISAYYADASKEVDLKQVAEVEAMGAKKALQSVVTVSLGTGLTDARLRTLVNDLLIQGAPSEMWWRRQSSDTAFRFANAVRQGIAQGETTAQIVQRVRGRPSQPGILEISRRNAEALVRTSVQEASSAADMAVYEDPEVVRGYRQISTLDGRTTNICKAYSDATWNFEKKPIGNNKLPFVSPGGSVNGTPRHWSCRSKIQPLLKPLSVLPEFRASTRASADGQIDAGITFDEWLSKKPKSFQDETLGKGRAELFRDGKITLAQLLDQSGRPLSLDELRRKYE